MLFGKKIDRVLNIREAEERFEKDREEQPLEKGDRLAMILAALIVFIPVFIGVVLALLLVLYLFFFRFM